MIGLETKKCLRCGGVIAPHKKKHVKFCSDRCRKNAWDTLNRPYKKNRIRCEYNDPPSRTPINDPAEEMKNENLP